VNPRAVIAIGTVLFAAVAAGCGSNDSASPSASTITVDATSFATLPTTPTTLPNATSVPAVAGEQQYTIQAGDYPIGVADKFGVDLVALEAANAATPGYADFFAGTIITIPAGGTTAVVTTTLPATGVTTAPPANTTTTTTVAGGQPNCGVGSYTIEAGDYPALVAEKFDTTVDELNAVNADTPGYSAFIVGVTIKIPAKTAC
jgi:LysM repeat protein